MPSGEGDARQILGAPDMADPWHAGLGVERPESFEMAGADAAEPRRAIGLSHDAGGILSAAVDGIKVAEAVAKSLGH